VPAKGDVHIDRPGQFRGDWHDGTGATGLIGIGQGASQREIHRRLRGRPAPPAGR
jgi:hypothetical protein